MDVRITSPSPIEDAAGNRVALKGERLAAVIGLLTDAGGELDHTGSYVALVRHILLVGYTTRQGELGNTREEFAKRGDGVRVSGTAERHLSMNIDMREAVV